VREPDRLRLLAGQMLALLYVHVGETLIVKVWPDGVQ
jgi:hypothetical protein